MRLWRKKSARFPRLVHAVFVLGWFVGFGQFFHTLDTKLANCDKIQVKIDWLNSTHATKKALKNQTRGPGEGLFDIATMTWYNDAFYRERSG